jgi:hypothetical protein
MAARAKHSTDARKNQKETSGSTGPPQVSSKTRMMMRMRVPIPMYTTDSVREGPMATLSVTLVPSCEGLETSAGAMSRPS